MSADFFQAIIDGDIDVVVSAVSANSAVLGECTLGDFTPAGCPALYVAAYAGHAEPERRLVEFRRWVSFLA